ncbi:Pvc16 family protein [Actinophytocola sp. KF-1]
MLRDIDNALIALLGTGVPGVAVLLGPGGDEPGLRVLLHDVREDQGALAAMWQDDHDATGRVVSRRHPVRRFRLRYLVFADAGDPATAHDWLGRALVVLAAHPVVPAGLLTGMAADAALPVPLQVAPPGLPELTRAVLAAVGTRPALDVVVTAPCVRSDMTGLPPAPDTVDLGVVAGAPRTAQRGRQAGPPGRRIREGRDG